MEVAVIGAGAMGSALALILDRAGHSVVLCATELDQPVLEALSRDRTHPSLQQHLPESIALATADAWRGPLGKAEVVGLAVASVGARDVVRSATPLLRQEAVWAVATKGWDPKTAEPLSEVIARESPGHPVVIVVGPSLAGEMAAGIPTGLVCASQDRDAAEQVASVLDVPTVRRFVTDDVVGVEVGAALKNVLAIAIGMCDGIAEARGGPMTNTKAALFSRGLVEMGRLAVALGGRRESVLGLAGAGDLFVTVLGGRNGRFGRLVGTGLDPEKALEEMGTTVEGYDNTKEALRLADRLDLDLPVARTVHAVLYGGADPHEAVASLLEGPVENEI